MDTTSNSYHQNEQQDAGTSSSPAPDLSEQVLFENLGRFAGSLTRVPPASLFDYILTEMKSLTGAKFASLSTYDPQTKALICRQFLLPQDQLVAFEESAGLSLAGYCVPVSQKVYQQMVENPVIIIKSLSKASFDETSRNFSLALEQLFGLNCYLVLPLVLNKRLIGTLLFGGCPVRQFSTGYLLQPFAAVIANAIELNEQEAEIKAGKEWFRTVAEDIPLMVCRISPEHKVIMSNRAYDAFFGKTPEEINKSSLDNLLEEDAHLLVGQHFETLTTASPIGTVEHQVINCRGEKRWVRWINRALFDESGQVKAYLGIGEDVTDSLKVLNRLKESEAVKSAVIETLPDLIILNDSKGQYLDILSGKDELLDNPRKEMIGKNIKEFLPQEIASNILALCSIALETGKMQTYEFSHPAAGRTVYFESRIKALDPGRVISFVRDITERKNIENALRRSEEKYREIIDSIQEAYYEIDLQGQLIFFNDSLVKMLGYEWAELKNISYKKFFRDPEKIYQAFHELYQSGQGSQSLTTEFTHKDGSLMFAEISASIIRDKEGSISGFRGLARNITERVRLENKLKYLSLHDQLTGLHNRTFFEQEVKRLENSSKYPIAMISADLDDLKLVNDSLGHQAGDRLLKAAATILKNSVRTEDVLARVGGDEFTVILPTTSAKTAELVAARIRNNLEKYNKQNPELPLGLSLGVATASAADKKLHEVFKQADDHMYQDKLYRSSQARTKTVEALMTALAERDFITDGHARRLDELCRQMGEIIGLSSRSLADLSLLAQVHDLGKVGIPDKILFKAGPLDAEEWEVMKLHPEKGYRIAVASPDLYPVAELILKHHERWDGQGYPLGLAGEDIPIECRILSIVDAFDAMTNDRPYRKAIKAEEALEEIRRCAGTQFDPRLADIFLSLLKD